MALNRFQVLKHKVINEPDLAQVWLYYMNNFVDDPAFIDLGNKTRDSFLEGVIPQICQQMFSKKERVSPLMLITISAHSFTHGGVEVGGRLGNLIYFKDLQKGVLAVPNKLTEKREVNYARFSNPLLGRSPVDYNQN